MHPSTIIATLVGIAPAILLVSNGRINLSLLLVTQHPERGSLHYMRYMG